MAFARRRRWRSRVRTGIMVLLQVPWSWSLYSNGTVGQATLRAQVDTFVRLHAGHPALLGWLVGNELNLHIAYNVWGRGGGSPVWTLFLSRSFLW